MVTCLCGCGKEITETSPSSLFFSEHCHDRFYHTEPHEIACRACSAIPEASIVYQDGSMIITVAR